MRSLSILCFGVSLPFSLSAQVRQLPPDTAVVTQHSITIKGAPVAYTAEVGTQPVFLPGEDEASAYLHYTYYTRNGLNDVAARPLLISFNGGPGSGSVWMHLAYTGPKLLSVDDEGYPVQPYTLRDNPYSLLDVADVVFVTPASSKTRKARRPTATGSSGSTRTWTTWPSGSTPSSREKGGG